VDHITHVDPIGKRDKDAAIVLQYRNISAFIVSASFIVILHFCYGRRKTGKKL